jgi:hypothetical protein
MTSSLRRGLRSRFGPVQTAVPVEVERLERRLALSVSLALTGTQTISSGSPANISNDDDFWESEMSVVVNPANPLNIAGLSHNIDRSTNPVTANALDLYYSLDGGGIKNGDVISISSD